MKEKTIVLTMYGTGEAINNFNITLFDDTDGYGDTTIQDYCNNINELELKDDNWIYAAKIKENKKIKFEKPRKLTDFNILCSLDDRAIQKVIREIDIFVLARALATADNKMLSAVLRNMSKRAAKMLIEDMENKNEIPKKDIQESQKKIVEIIQHLEMTGEIVHKSDF